MCIILRSLNKSSCKQSSGARKCPASCLFFLFHLTLGQQTTPPSCLNVLNDDSMWMAWSCSQKSHCVRRWGCGGGGMVGWGGLLVIPPVIPIPLLLHNGFTLHWLCSNEVWMNVLWRHREATVWKCTLYFSAPSSPIHLLKYQGEKIQTYFHHTPLNICGRRPISLRLILLALDSTWSPNCILLLLSLL